MQIGGGRDGVGASCIIGGVLIRATQCWLGPDLVNGTALVGNRLVSEILGLSGVGGGGGGGGGEYPELRQALPHRRWEMCSWLVEQLHRAYLKAR